jgi:tetratricopeptide (TPR) repeat protein
MSGPEEGRFLEVEAPGYSARFVEASDGKGRSLELELERADLFAWTEAPLYRHSDFALEGEFAMPSGQAHSACGFLFRYQDEGNFYSILVSNKGLFRLDVVFNRSPRALVAWTEIAPPSARGGDGASFSLRVIARGGHFTIIIDDEWVAEAADESFNRGHIAFAAQNYGEGGRARFDLRSCMVDSRPLELETWYYRWNYYIVPDSAARRRLAETLFAMGDSLAAAVQIRKIEKRRPLDADELFLKAETALRLGLEPEAEEALDACLALDPGRTAAAEEKANILYLRGRYLELRDQLATLLPEKRDNSRLLCLSGHARFGLGDYLGAAAEYRAAADLALRSGEGAGASLFRMNEARAWDQAGKKTEAADAYLAAARLFSDQEADDDLALALQRLSALKAKNAEVKEIKGKALYRAGKKDAAARMLAELVARGSTDSGTHYTLGLILAEKGQGEKALERFEAALALEPDFPLYLFRYAERLFLLGRDAHAAIERALERSGADDRVAGWTFNLAGQEALARGDLTSARRHLEAARNALPGEREPSINLADLESREGRIDEALAALAPFPEDAACRNQAGNVHVRAAGPEKSEERLEAAVREYSSASILDPSSSEYQSNLAATYLELERYSEAEERIRKALDLGGGPRALLIAGNLATAYGDLPRAEAAYRLGLAASPEDPALVAALGACYLALGNVAKAEAAALRLEAESPERAVRLRSEIENATTETLSCSACGRTWRVPRDLPRQSSANVRAMPPDESPAGECPRCGRIFCIACRKAGLVDSRFTCPDCGEALKLTDNRLRYLVRESIRRVAI